MYLCLHDANISPNKEWAKAQADKSKLCVQRVTWASGACDVWVGAGVSVGVCGCPWVCGCVCGCVWVWVCVGCVVWCGVCCLCFSSLSLHFDHKL